MRAAKTYILFAGPNGAGKTTFFKKLEPACADRLGLRVNTDEIVKLRFGNDWRSARAQTAAARLAVGMIRNCISEGRPFNQETTLAGKTVLTSMGKAKENGFRVSVFYVGLESPELSVERVAKRVEQGGHGMPDDVLFRRYHASLRNLEIALSICDEGQIYDNSASDMANLGEPVFVVSKGGIVHAAENVPAYFRNVFAGYAGQVNERRCPVRPSRSFVGNGLAGLSPHGGKLPAADVPARNPTRPPSPLKCRGPELRAENEERS